MGKTCSMQWEMRNVYIIYVGIKRYIESLILKCIFKNWCVHLWSGFNLIKISNESNLIFYIIGPGALCFGVHGCITYRCWNVVVQVYPLHWRSGTAYLDLSSEAFSMHIDFASIVA